MYSPCKSTRNLLSAGMLCCKTSYGLAMLCRIILRPAQMRIWEKFMRIEDDVKSVLLANACLNTFWTYILLKWLTSWISNTPIHCYARMHKYKLEYQFKKKRSDYRIPVHFWNSSCYHDTIIQSQSIYVIVIFARPRKDPEKIYIFVIRWYYVRVIT